MKNKESLLLLARYIALILLAIPNLYIFYKVFTPLTVEPVFYFLNKLYGAVYLPGNIIFFKGYYANILPACVAGAAYYLLLIFNLTTPMSVLKRTFSIFFLMLSFLILNIARIVIFARLFTVGYKYFDLTHTLTWYFGSTLLVVLIWFLNVWIFKIDSIPVYTDIKALFKDTKINKSFKDSQ